MPKKSENTVRSLSDFLARVERVQAKAKNSLWYRGVGDATYKLVPALYRHEKTKGAKELAKLEWEIMTRFKQRSLPYLSRPLVDEWETLFFMQHYGVPTRLLDWTENPFIALYFALMSAKSADRKNAEQRFSADAALWILDPVAWNRHALQHISYQGGVLTPDDDTLKAYRPARDPAGAQKFPVAIYGVHNSPRIVAQQGVFTVFGQEACAMEELVPTKKFPAKILTRILVEKKLLAGMREALLKYGVTESAVFPDLDGLARETKRLFGF